jgi:hypothetical protein
MMFHSLNKAADDTHISMFYIILYWKVMLWLKFYIIKSPTTEQYISVNLFTLTHLHTSWHIFPGEHKQSIIEPSAVFCKLCHW